MNDIQLSLFQRNIHDIMIKPNKKTNPAMRNMKSKASSDSVRKAPGAPKRFKSSYILFFMSVQKDIKNSLPQGQSNAPTVSKVVSKLWKNLPTEKREHWDKEAEKEKIRYQMEKVAYKGPWTVPKERAKKDPCAPRRNPSAFLLFSKYKRNELKGLCPGLKNTDFSRMLGIAWNKASIEEKAPFLRQELKERNIYKRRMNNWKKNNALRASIESQFAPNIFDIEEVADASSNESPHPSDQNHYQEQDLSFAPIPWSCEDENGMDRINAWSSGRNSSCNHEDKSFQRYEVSSDEESWNNGNHNMLIVCGQNSSMKAPDHKQQHDDYVHHFQDVNPVTMKQNNDTEPFSFKQDDIELNQTASTRNPNLGTANMNPITEQFWNMKNEMHNNNYIFALTEGNKTNSNTIPMETVTIPQSFSRSLTKSMGDTMKTVTPQTSSRSLVNSSIDDSMKMEPSRTHSQNLMSSIDNTTNNFTPEASLRIYINSIDDTTSVILDENFLKEDNLFGDDDDNSLDILKYIDDNDTNMKTSFSGVHCSTMETGLAGHFQELDAFCNTQPSCGPR